MKGKGLILSSQFKLSYNMILNLLRVEDVKVEDMLRRSFSEYHTQRSASTAQFDLEEVRVLSFSDFTHMSVWCADRAFNARMVAWTVILRLWIDHSFLPE